MLLFALLPFVLHGNGIAYPDEGVYAAQAETLAHGSWFEERPAAELRGLQALDGLGPEVVKGNLFAGYVRHSLYMRLLVPFWRLVRA